MNTLTKYSLAREQGLSTLAVLLTIEDTSLPLQALKR